MIARAANGSGGCGRCFESCLFGGAERAGPSARNSLRGLLAHTARSGRARGAHRCAARADPAHDEWLSSRTDLVPLRVHAHYSRDEVCAAFGEPERAANLRQGVWHVLAARSADVFFVTLRKTEAHYSPTTMYADHAVSPDLFQWESQSTTTVRSATGQRYINHVKQGSSVHLFVRGTKEHGWRSGCAAVPVRRADDLRGAPWRTPDPIPLAPTSSRYRPTCSTLPRSRRAEPADCWCAPNGSDDQHDHG